MKQWIKPPIQAFLWLSGGALCALTGWSFLNLQLLEEQQKHPSDSINVKIPDASALDAPDLNSYPQMVSTPLFWVGRKAIEPEPVAAAPVEVAVPVDTTLPEGRLIGIIDMGESLFAVMENAAGGSVHLRKGDKWGAWDVTGIDPDRLLLGIGDKEQVIPLVADFTAPQESPQVAQARVVQQQAAQQQAAMRATRQPAVAQPMVAQAAGNVPVGAGLPFPADTEKQPPALSVNDALEARQRLMASRWGGLTGDEQQPAPQPAGTGK
jgi:hypothetical protein